MSVASMSKSLCGKETGVGAQLGKLPKLEDKLYIFGFLSAPLAPS